MAVVQGIRERVHSPLYDSVKVDPEGQLRDQENSGTLKFFANVQGKTKLETNLQSASLLPHYNTFEARAMRVVISDLPPEFPTDVSQEDKDRDVTIDGSPIDKSGNKNPAVGANVLADLDIDLATAVSLLKDAKDSTDGTTTVDLDDPDLVTKVHDASGTDLSGSVGTLVNMGAVIEYTVGELEDLIAEFDDKDQPLDVQLDSNNGSGTLIGKIVYNTVTSLYVGEKLMIQMPTWFFPSGAGPYSETASITTHGTPSPQDTFRFAEPIYIDRQQNFRVEIEVPDSDVLKELQRIYGPFFMWVVLDGYMTRDVQ
jgi:hypothetical protein